ncbi:MAG: plasmid mobilization relaxosome protein MobC [bacterium]
MSRDTSFRFRLSDDLKSRLEELADRNGNSQADVIRSLIENQELPPPNRTDPDGISELNRQVASIGNNLNQLARIGNQYDDPSYAKMMTALVTIQRQIEDVKDRFLSSSPTAPTTEDD